MIFKEQSSYKVQIKTLLNKMKSVNKWQHDFVVETLGLFLAIKGRVNFMQLSRYSNHGEQYFRNQFNKPFDFLSFNKELIVEHGGKHLTIALDPSYVSKSGKFTSGTGYFWSGVAGKAKWGLEISGIATIDIDNHTAFHLEAVQTPSNLKSETLLDHYTKLIINRKQILLSISKYVVADAYFSKYGFVSNLCDTGFEAVSRLRDDADLKYLYRGVASTSQGRPKKYDGKIKYTDLKAAHVTLLEQNAKNKVYQAIVFSKALKREINLVIVYTNKKGKWAHKLYFSTDLKLSAQTILKYYRTRFQIEFTFRDAKQHTGLNHCQARNQNKLNTHFNMALTTINIAKINNWIHIDKDKREAFSMADVKTIHHNELLLKKFFNVFGISPNLTKNKEKIDQLRYYGAKAA
jgi:hypothetical protein